MKILKITLVIIAALLIVYGVLQKILHNPNASLFINIAVFLFIGVFILVFFKKIR